MLLSTRCLEAIEKYNWETRTELDAKSIILQAELNLLEYLWGKHIFYEFVKNRIVSTYGSIDYWRERMQTLDDSLMEYYQLSYVKQRRKIKEITIGFSIDEVEIDRIMQMVKNRGDLDVIRFIVWVNIKRELESKLTLTQAKSKYKLGKNDLQQVPYETYSHGLYGTPCRLYVEDNVKNYVKLKIGQKLLDEKRKKSEERSEKISTSRQSAEQKRIEMRKERHQNVLDLLARFNLFFVNDARFTVDYIEGYMEYNEKRILNEVSHYNKRRMEMDIRADLLEEEMEKYGIEIREDSQLCNRYIKIGFPKLEHVVNVMRDIDFIAKNTKYFTNGRYRLSYNPPEICKKFSRIFDTKDDVRKTLAIYDKVRQGHLQIEENMPPTIKQRIAMSENLLN